MDLQITNYQLKPHNKQIVSSILSPTTTHIAHINKVEWCIESKWETKLTKLARYTEI